MFKRRTTFIKPALTPENKLQRVEHALSFIDDTTLAFEPMHNMVHVDEKWFYADRNKRSYLVFDGEEPPPRLAGEITDSERQAVWETLLLRSVGEVVKHGEIVRVAAYFRVGRQVVERIWRRGINSMGDRVAAVVKSRKSACGRKKVDRAELCERIAAVPVNERENQRLLQRASNMSYYLVQQLIKEGYIRRALRQTRPLLTPTHKFARLRHKDKQVRAGTLPKSLPCDAISLANANAYMLLLAASSPPPPTAKVPEAPLSAPSECGDA
ncbi:hypothetical protein PInf_026423 [Phytophthora infestans]|nr:hypothetical protein PInf_026423 [Phytophthora infestans]